MLAISNSNSVDLRKYDKISAPILRSLFSNRERMPIVGGREVSKDWLIRRDGKYDGLLGSSLLLAKTFEELDNFLVHLCFAMLLFSLLRDSRLQKYDPFNKEQIKTRQELVKKIVTGTYVADYWDITAPREAFRYVLQDKQKYALQKRGL
jgi:hypothetical protein